MSKYFNYIKYRLNTNPKAPNPQIVCCSVLRTGKLVRYTWTPLYILPERRGVGGIARKNMIFKHVFPSVEIVPTPRGSILYPTGASQVPYNANIYIYIYIYIYIFIFVDCITFLPPYVFKVFIRSEYPWPPSLRTAVPQDDEDGAAIDIDAQCLVLPCSSSWKNVVTIC